MSGFPKQDARAGRIFDLADTLANPESMLFPPHVEPMIPDSSASDTNNGTPAQLPNSARYRDLVGQLEALQGKKLSGGDRNTWQEGKSPGGRGEPWTYDPRGFGKMWWATADSGRALYKMKWGTDECNLDVHGVKPDDTWTGG